MDPVDNTEPHNACNDTHRSTGSSKDVMVPEDTQTDVTKMKHHEDEVTMFLDEVLGALLDQSQKRLNQNQTTPCASPAPVHGVSASATWWLT